MTVGELTRKTATYVNTILRTIVMQKITLPVTTIVSCVMQIYLMNYAECLVETGTNPADAAVYVDKVRERAGLAKLKDSQWKDCLSSKDAFIKRLQMERTLELCFEGWRWADLKRWGLLDSQAGIDELKARDKDFNNFIVGKHRRLPIPRDEVDEQHGRWCCTSYSES